MTVRTKKLIFFIVFSSLIFNSVNGRGRGGGGWGKGGGRGGSWFSSRSSSRYPSTSSSRSSRRSSSSSTSQSYYSSSSKHWSIPTTKNFNVLKPILTRIRLSSKETNYGTAFTESTKKLMTTRIPRKMFGLGVGAAFIGGAGFGFGAGLASYSIYHRYHQLRWMLHDNGYEVEWDTDYYNEYYEKNACVSGCPTHSHCEWGFCECDEGFTKSFGQCSSSATSTSTTYHPNNHMRENPANTTCRDTVVCQGLDINAVCAGNTCACRRDMQWNIKALECQILLDVDCSAITYYTPISALVRRALQNSKPKPKPKRRRRSLTQDFARCFMMTDPQAGVRCSTALLDPQNLNRRTNLQPKPEPVPEEFPKTEIPNNRTETKEESLSASLLKFVDAKNASKENLEEAFCRDIDAFSEAFQAKDVGRPWKCAEMQAGTCAALHDSGTCAGGWVLRVTPGTQRRFLYFSSDWKYRNDIDTIGVRSGCTFTGFTGSSFDGRQIVLPAGSADRWIVLKNWPYTSFHEDIESFQCVCRG